LPEHCGCAPLKYVKIEGKVQILCYFKAKNQETRENQKIRHRMENERNSKIANPGAFLLNDRLQKPTNSGTANSTKAYFGPKADQTNH
jgi:hypothetical protein